MPLALQTLPEGYSWQKEGTKGQGHPRLHYSLERLTQKYMPDPDMSCTDRKLDERHEKETKSRRQHKKKKTECRLKMENANIDESSPPLTGYYNY